MVCGTWMTLGTVVPDYAQRMTTPKSVTLGVLVGLPAFAAAAALVGSSLAQAPNLALYSALLVACLVTNAATNVVGPMTWVKQGAGRRLSSGAAATIVTSIAAVAAYAVLPWQTVVAYASWAVGAGALFVAPAAGVVVADYWVCRDRVVDRDALQTAAATGACAYAGGTNYRAVAALFAGMVPELWSFASNIAADLAARNAGALTLQSVMDSVRALIGWFVFNSEYSAVIAAATAFVAYVSLTVMFVPESLKVARAEAAALSADERAARERARRRRRGGGECRGDGQVRRRRRRRRETTRGAARRSFRRVLLRRGHRVPRGVQGGDGGGNRGHHGDASEAPPRERVHRDRH